MRINPSALALASLLIAQSGLAQAPDARPTPRFKEPQRPGVTRFEPPPPADDEALPEVIVSADREEWRLPDLGSEWRIEQEEQEEADKGRIEVTFLPLYDPETAPRNPDLFQLNKEEERVGKIELFRFKFGRKRRQ